MEIKTAQELQRIKEQYPKGTSVRLIKLADKITNDREDFNKLVPGMYGTVYHIDDLGTIFINWDKGFSLGIILKEDEIKIEKNPNLNQIRFITPHYKMLFVVNDGEEITINYPQGSLTGSCKYDDDYHFSFNNHCYHICQFAEIMESNNIKYYPVFK